MVYTITCNAALTDLSGKTIDKLSYADTHVAEVVFENKPVSDSTDKPDSDKPAEAPNTGDNAPLDWMLISTALMTAVLMSNYAFYRKNKKN